jgi:hypothetical protein
MNLAAVGDGDFQAQTVGEGGFPGGFLEERGAGFRGGADQNAAGRLGGREVIAIDGFGAGVARQVAGDADQVIAGLAQNGVGILGAGERHQAERGKQDARNHMAIIR